MIRVTLALAEWWTRKGDACYMLLYYDERIKNNKQINLFITSIKPKHQGFFLRASHGLIEPVEKSPSIVFIDGDVAGVVPEIYIRLAR